MNPPPGIRVGPVDYATALAELRVVREAVFVREQGVPRDIELDALDPDCRHVLARDADGRPIGTGRLTPSRRIGRMAVLAEWRGRGVGDALLQALVDEARALGWDELSLHAQASAIDFYARHGFLPEGDRFVEAGIEHLTMRRRLDAANPVDSRAGARAAMLGVIAGARRMLYVYSRSLDPGLLDAPEVVSAFRRFATGRGVVHILLHDPAAAQRAVAPLVGLSQRLPSAFAFRAVEEPGDREYPAAFAVNDLDGWYYRPLGHRFDGDTRVDGGARARQLRYEFEPFWERARAVTEFRALGI